MAADRDDGDGRGRVGVPPDGQRPRPGYGIDARTVASLALIASGSVLAVCAVAALLGYEIRGLADVMLQISIPIFAASLLLCARRGWLPGILDALAGAVGNRRE